MTAKFLRRGWSRYSKLGLRRKKKQKWKKPTGRDNKMRDKRRGYPVVVSIGYGTENKGLIENKKKVLVNNLKDLEKAGKDSIIVLGKIGKKKKIEILKKAKEKKLTIWKTSIEKFLKKSEKKTKKIVSKKPTEDKKTPVEENKK